MLIQSALLADRERLLRAGSFTLVNSKDGKGGGEREEMTQP